MAAMVFRSDRHARKRQRATGDRVKIARFDCWRSDECIMLRGDFPGATVDHLEIEFHQGVLTISSALEKNDASRAYTLREYSSMSQERQFRIPDEVDSDGIVATVAEGVLTVRLPIVKPEEPRRIKVTQFANGDNPEG